MKTRLVLLWLFNLIDTAATLYLYLFYDGIEVNPISVLLLRSPQVFANVKLSAMTIVVWLLLRKRDSAICKAASWILFIEYFAVVIYYIVIFAFVLKLPLRY